jgi:molybdopterin/thiamine biosynthesis adenylyltransferase
MTPFERMTWDQDYLKDKHLLLIGCGGLAHAALPYLLSSGIGTVTLFDGDLVEASNLNRQHLFSPSDIGKNKSLVLKEYCTIHFPEVKIVHSYLEEGICFVGKDTYTRGYKTGELYYEDPEQQEWKDLAIAEFDWEPYVEE